MAKRWKFHHCEPGPMGGFYWVAIDGEMEKASQSRFVKSSKTFATREFAELDCEEWCGRLNPIWRKWLKQFGREYLDAPTKRRHEMDAIKWRRNRNGK